ncbi:MAG: hypothetical protein RLY71_3945 [Pseudomonadota bacterium]|jgi:uncharacterized protein
MIRLLWWLVLGLIGWAVWRSWRHGSRDIKARQAQPSAPPVPPARQVRDQLMVACAHCGVHLPRDEALADPGGQLYCSAPHRDAGTRLPPR